MSITIYPDLMQGTDEWRQARLGMVTASEVDKLLTSTLRIASNASSRGLAATLTAERITGHVDVGYESADMWRGHVDEPAAREVYSEHHAPVTEVGLMVRDFGDYKLGYSPDGLVGECGLIEIKSRLQKVHLQTILDDRVPDENMAQLQCGLLVSGRAWIDYVSYCGGMPLWVKRVTPDLSWQAAILAAVEALEESAADMTARYHAAVEGLPITERVNRDADIEF